jgi:DeoR/GlpR family transcriptional regulator of sugar metabolism
MLQEERQNIIINQMNLHHKVLTTDLSKLLNVSLDTVRRDLHELEESGRIVKVHGGAVSKSFHIPFQQPKVHAKEEKKEVAYKALSFFKDGMNVLMSGGTIMLELARIIPKNHKGTVFTVSPLVALEIAQRSNIRVILIGGEVSHDAYVCTGPTVISQLSELHVDLAFIGANGLTVKTGLTDHDWDVVQVKKALMKAADKTIVMCISEKLDLPQKLIVNPLRAIQVLVTDLSPTDKQLLKYSKSVKVI